MPYDRHNEVKLQRQIMASHAEQRSTAITVEANTAAIAINTAKTSFTVAAQDAVNANTLKETNATHTGAITGDVDLVITAGAVTNLHIATGAVKSANIGNNEITNEKIANYAVDTLQIAGEAVTTNELGGAAVNTTQIADEAVTKDKLGFDSVGYQQLDDGAVINTKIGALAVTTGKIALLAVDEAQLNTGAVTNEKLDSMEALRLKGNDAAIGGVPKNLTVTETLAMLGVDLKLLPKAFGSFTTTSTPVVSGESFNISGVSKVANGRYTVSFTNNMSGTDYIVTTSYMDSTETVFLCMLSSKAVGSFNISLKNGGGTLSDLSESVDIVVHEYV
tara:strand:- start:1055 stop:2056 length:1002 start_codon:yes stop_codon:yes gene_type:complete